MKPCPSKSGVRQNTASPRQHDLRLATHVRRNSNWTKEQDIQTRMSASDNRTSSADLPNLCNAAPQRAATGGEACEATPLAVNLSGCETRFGIERPLTCEEAAELVRVHPKTVKRMARERETSRAFSIRSLVLLCIRAGRLDANRVTFIASLVPLEQTKEKSSCSSEHDISSAICVGKPRKRKPDVWVWERNATGLGWTAQERNSDCRNRRPISYRSTGMASG